MFWHYCLLAIVWRATWKLNKRAVGFTMLVGLPLCVTNPLLAGEAAVIFYDAVDKVAMTLPEDCGKPLPNLLESIRTWQSEQDYQAIGYVSRSLPTTMNSDNYHKTVQ